MRKERECLCETIFQMRVYALSVYQLLTKEYAARDIHLMASTAISSIGERRLAMEHIMMRIGYATQMASMCAGYRHMLFQNHVCSARSMTMYKEGMKIRVVDNLSDRCIGSIGIRITYLRIKGKVFTISYKAQKGTTLATPDGDRRYCDIYDIDDENGHVCWLPEYAMRPVNECMFKEA